LLFFLKDIVINNYLYIDDVKEIKINKKVFLKLDAKKEKQDSKILEAWKMM